MDYEVMQLERDLCERLKFNFDENDVDLQEKYFGILNKVIDGVLLLRYDKYKSDAPLSSVVKINDFVLSYFNRINHENLDAIFEEMEEEVHFFVNSDYEGEKYSQIVRELFNIYTSNYRSLPQDKTNAIYNRLLNEQQDVYVSKNRKKLIPWIMSMLPLTDQKRNLLITASKMKDAKRLIEFRSFEQLGTTEEELKKNLLELHTYLNHIKPFHKEENRLTALQFSELDQLFLDNSLNSETVCQICPNISKSAVKKILSKYNQILIPYLDNLSVSENSLSYENVEFNYNHLKILSREKYNQNLDKLICLMNKKEKRYLLSHTDDLKDVFQLLSFVCLFRDDEFFNMAIFKSMLINYDKIRNTMVKQGTVEKNCSFDELLDHFKEFLRLAIVYKNADIYTVSILGEERVEKITLNNKNNSCNSYDYVNTYIEMLREENSFLPPISFEMEIGGASYKIESGNNYDIDRLLLGKNVEGSCIGPGSVDGEVVFYQCLTKKDADLVLVKDIKTGEFFARMILLRLGNSVVIAPIYGKNGLVRELYNDEFLTTISNIIVKESRKVGDHLEYIFLANCSSVDKKYDLLVSYDIKDYVPHCDVCSSVNVLYNENRNIDGIDYGMEPKAIYEKVRRKIEIKEENYLVDIMRLRALYLLMSNSNEKLQEEVCKYKRVYLGQDFYIGVLEDDSIDSVVLPVHSARQKAEIDICLNAIVNQFGASEDILDSICLKKVTIHSFIKKYPQI